MASKRPLVLKIEDIVAGKTITEVFHLDYDACLAFLKDNPVVTSFFCHQGTHLRDIPTILIGVVPGLDLDDFIHDLLTFRE